MALVHKRAQHILYSNSIFYAFLCETKNSLKMVSVTVLNQCRDSEGLGLPCWSGWGEGAKKRPQNSAQKALQLTAISSAYLVAEAASHDGFFRWYGKDLARRRRRRGLQAFFSFMESPSF